MFKSYFNDPKRGSTDHYPVPFSYLDRIFRLSGEDYKENSKVESVLANTLGIGFSMKRARRPRIFTPPLPPGNHPKRTPEEDPLNAGDTGAIIYCGYYDMTGRPGMALALMPQVPFSNPELNNRVIIAFHGYLGDDGNFYIHQLCQPTFDFTYKRHSATFSHERLGEDEVSICMLFAEKMAAALFEGKPFDLYGEWTGAQNSVRMGGGRRPWAPKDESGKPPIFRRI